MKLVPHLGCNALPFGSDVCAITALLGKPESIEEDEDADRRLVYPQHGLELVLVAEHEHKLGSITAISSKHTLNGIPIIGAPERALEAPEIRHLLGDLIVTDNLPEISLKHYESKQFDVLFLVLNGIVKNMTLFAEHEAPSAAI